MDEIAVLREIKMDYFHMQVKQRKSVPLKQRKSINLNRLHKLETFTSSRKILSHSAP